MEKMEDKSGTFSVIHYSISNLIQSDIDNVDRLIADTNKKQIEAELKYFNPYFDLSYEEEKVATIGRKVYYWTVVLFVQRM